MLAYDTIDISEGIHVNKTNASQNVIFVEYGPYLCNVCHDLMQKAINFNNVTLVSVKVSDDRIHF